MKRQTTLNSLFRSKTTKEVPGNKKHVEKEMVEEVQENKENQEKLENMAEKENEKKGEGKKTVSEYKKTAIDCLIEELSEDEKEVQVIKSDDDKDADYVPVVTPPAKKVKKSPKPTASGSKSKKKKVGGLTVEQHRRKLGDAVKQRLSMEKYCMKADCHSTVKLPLEMFREIVVPHACDVTPSHFDASTPVVVASVRGRQAAGEIFGKSKIRGGNRYEQCEMEKAEIVYFPTKQKARIWWIMYSQFYGNDDSEEEEEY